MISRLTALLLLIPGLLPAKPNVLMICIDDLNDWVGCLRLRQGSGEQVGGHPDTITPHIDALAAKGRNFTNAHCQVTVCSPSRISVLSGWLPSSTGSYELGPAYEEIPALAEAPTMLGWFRENGYKTLAGGKVLHHGFRGRLAGDVEVDLGKKKGSPRPKEALNWKLGPWDWGPFPADDSEMADHQLARSAAKELAHEHDRPFFLAVGFVRPHVPLYVPPKWFDLFDPATIALPEDPVADMTDIPTDFQGGLGVAPTLEEIREKEKWRSLVHAYLASTAFVDDCVGIVMEALAAGPHAETTTVVLWSDHGFHLGEKNHIAKRTLWEESTRVPFVFAGPAIEPGDCAEPVGLVDLFPTLTEFCGIPSPAKLDGTSLVPQLVDAAAARDLPALSASFEGNWSVRDRDWRYIRYASGAEELYDHRSDPEERTNLASEPEMAERKETLASFLPADPAPEFKPLSERERKR